MKVKISILLALFPTAALAHGGHAAGTFWAGAGHPLSGADHVIAMLAVGLLAWQAGGRALWALPAGFVGAMLLGGLWGAQGLPLALAEPMILASLIILGVLLGLALRLPLGLMVPMVAVFGAAHGWAHGAEGPVTGLAAYAAGFALSTAALHGAGIVLAKAFDRGWLRGFGGGIATAGLALVFAG